ncbi:DUF3081 family protein [Granulosicoccaceae sp. 1_MG-2023]|nr:DUF3081 family protein [Granulosicoccaceae sp. 1_MG-2023]
MSNDPFKTHGNEQLDVEMALQAFSKVCQYGEKVGDWYVLEGVKAKPSADGYTVYLGDQDTCVSIFFHNKFSTEFQMHSDYENMVRKLELIAATDFEEDAAEES